MKKMILASIAAAGMIFGSIPSAAVFAAEGDGQVKEVYIDNTVDNSQSTVIGKLTITDTEAADTTAVQVYSGSASVMYSNTRTDEVNGLIAEAEAAVRAYASDNGYTITSDVIIGEVTELVWDNRKYTTVEDGDAVLIGDSDYLTGAYGADGIFFRTHIAEGDYGKNTTYTIELKAEKAAETQVDQTSNDTSNETAAAVENTDSNAGTGTAAASNTTAASKTVSAAKHSTAKKSPATGNSENRGHMVMFCAISLGAFGVVFTRGRKKSR